MRLPEAPASRTAVRTVGCPRCGAAPGLQCIGVRAKQRESNHRERIHSYQRTAPHRLRTLTQIIEGGGFTH